MIKACSVVIAVLVVAQARSQEEPFNPFLTPSKTITAPVETPNVVTSLDGYQFNGIMKIDGKTRISVFDTNSNKNHWLTEGEMSTQGISFQRFDSNNKTVVITQGGVNKKLSLNKVKIESLKISQPVATTPLNATPQTNVARAAGPAKVETDEEARARIQRVAEEIRRRRAERRKKLESRGN